MRVDIAILVIAIASAGCTLPCGPVKWLDVDQTWLKLVRVRTTVWTENPFADPVTNAIPVLSEK